MLPLMKVLCFVVSTVCVLYVRYDLHSANNVLAMLELGHLPRRGVPSFSFYYERTASKDNERKPLNINLQKC